MGREVFGHWIRSRDPAMGLGATWRCGNLAMWPWERVLGPDHGIGPGSMGPDPWNLADITKIVLRLTDSVLYFF